MKKAIFSKVIFIIFCCVFFAGCGNNRADIKDTAYKVTDYQGTVVNFKTRPKRILTLSMSTDEIVLGLVKPDKLVAVNTLLDDPVSSNIAALAKQIPTKIKNPSVERICSLQPDLVIVPDWNNISIVDNLRDMGINVIVVPGPKNIAQVKQSINIIADALGRHSEGTELTALMDKKIAEIEKKVSAIPKDKRKKIVLVSLMTTYGGIGSTFDDACKYAGVINGVSAAGIHNGQALTKEMLVKINPDILLMPVYDDHGKFNVKTYNEKYLNDPSLQTIKAIKNNALVYPREGYIYNASQDIVFSIQEIARCAYGKEFDFPANMHLSVVK
ncbi:ABC transporter substrate-binding protein [Pectinatus sottacetonis]|uniref:ABC transporter substrate-binding protein n=1 Tax=Pectinatus sottacetonis TaxID=1002795 RepID=UPI0018C841B3|nr:ABC transporter substrate-binding protein [Pectinatus sottacetonis]